MLVSLLTIASNAQVHQIDAPGKLIVPPNAIQDEYLVVFMDSILPDQVPEVARRIVREHTAKLEKTWSAGLKGMFVRMNEKQALAMSRRPDVAFVEQNARTFLSDSQQTFVDPATCDPTVSNCATQTDNRLWHLDQIGQTWATSDDQYKYCTTGQGVKIYVVDSGVMGQHQEFLRPDGSSRVEQGENKSRDGDLFPANDPCGGWPVDPGMNPRQMESENYKYQIGNGAHGTGVASVAAGLRLGVAKDATIVPVKVRRCGEYSARAVQRNHYYDEGAFVLAYNKRGFPSTYVAHHSPCVAPCIPGTTGSWDPFLVDSTPNTQLDGGVEWRLYVTIQDSTEMVVSGLDWVFSQICPSKDDPCTTRINLPPAVVTMSVATIPAPEEETAEEIVIKKILAAGVPVIASANNQNADACTTSPARLSRYDNVITVGGSMRSNVLDRIDSNQVPESQQPNGRLPSEPGGSLEPDHDLTKPSVNRRWICGAGDTTPCSPTEAGSNGGQCVTLFAPAKNIALASLVGASSYRDPRYRGTFLSGTSWSAPIVAGVVARLLESSPTMSVAAVHQALMNNTTTLDSTGLDPENVTGTPNRLLNLKEITIVGPGDSAGAATLSVTALGPGPFTYQWYQTHPDFDLANRRGDARSDKLAGKTGPTLSVSAPTSRTGYWVRVSNNCSQVESDIAIVDPAPSLAPPASFFATWTQSLNQIFVAWEPVPGATGYAIEQKLPGLGWTAAENVPGQYTSGYITLPQTNSRVALYRIRAMAGSTTSDPSNVDVTRIGAFAVADTVVPGAGIDAALVVDLRELVNALCAAADIPPAFGAAEVGEGARLALRKSEILTIYFTDLMIKLNQARSAATLPEIEWTFGRQPASQQPIWASIIEDLRNGIR